MKRYFIVNEFFGIRLYDSVNKIETYYNLKEAYEIKKKYDGKYNYIDNKRDKQISAPLKISMNLTKKCNLRCLQCFSNSGVCSKNELTTEEIYKLFDDMKDNGTFFICLGGGEPFTRLDLFDILEYGKKKAISCFDCFKQLVDNKRKNFKAK
ncbi:MAG: radical SAM protein [Mollicutes bacterium]|nr:radical SAM protein [Mollicutes bacterium]